MRPRVLHVEATPFDVLALANQTTGAVDFGRLGRTPQGPIAAATHEIQLEPTHRAISRYQHTRLARYAPESARSQIGAAIERVVSSPECADPGSTWPKRLVTLRLR